MKILSEFKRRNVHRMAALYLAAAWLVMQVLDVVEGKLPLPNWMGSALLAVLAVGFPIALIISWFYEVTPEGISRDTDEEPAEAAAGFTGRRVDFVIIAVLAAAVLVFAYDKWWLPEPTEQSVAVLPFVNMSTESDSEYFADGLTEEIINSLAHVPQLLVTARISAFAFKDRNLPIAEIAETLGVAHVVAGSVRRAQGKLRITAQLIRASDGLHLWSETFDRDLSDIFVIQEEIANEVASALKLSMLNETVERLDRENTENIDAVIEYFLALENLSPKTTESVPRAVAHLEKAIKLDPEYARAYAMLGRAYLSMRRYGGMGEKEALAAARDASSRALDIAPGSSGALAVLGAVELAESNVDAGAQLLQQAVENGPNDVLALRYYADHLASESRLSESEDYYRRALRVDPLEEEIYIGLAWNLLTKQNVREALETITRLKEVVPDAPGAYQMETFCLFLLGDYAGSVAASHEAMLIDPDDSKYPSDIAMMHLLADMPEEAHYWFDRAAAINPSRFDVPVAPLYLSTYLQQNDEEGFRLARELLVKGGANQYALMVLVDYGARLGRHDVVLETLENLYPHVFAEPPQDFEVPSFATYYSALALLRSGDIDRGTRFMKAYLKALDSEQLAWRLHWGGITGRLALGETDAAMLKFREFARARWYFAGLDLRYMMRHSSIFDPIRNESEFIELLELYETNAAKQRQLLQAMNEAT